MQLRAIFIFFILAACCFFIVLYRKKKEPFVANMDDVMNYYCEETQPGKDDYKGPWDRVASPKCVTSTCPLEDCWTLEPKNFGRRSSYYWKYENAPEMRSNAGTESNVSNVCITKHNTPNSNARRCGTKPDTGRCEQNIFNPTPDRKCCTWNNQEKRWGCSMYNYFLNSNNVCQFREVYGDNVMNEDDCTDQFPICSTDTERCPDNSVIRETYNSNGECVWGTCESCSNEGTDTCWTYDSATRTWNGKRYMRFFGIPFEGSTTRQCGWYEINEIGEQLTYLTRPDPCDSKPNDNIPNNEEICYDLQSTRTPDFAYLQDTISYNAAWDRTGSNIEWNTSTAGYVPIPHSNVETYFNTSNSNCYPSCPIGTSLTNSYRGSGTFSDLGQRACVPCGSNQYYTGSNCDIEENYVCCQELTGCSNVFEKMEITTITKGRTTYVSSNNTCSNCGPNGFTINKYDQACTYCDSGKNYYNTSTNRCSVCDDSNQYIEVESNWRVCTTCPTTQETNGNVYYDESQSNCKFQCIQGYQGGGVYSNGAYPSCEEIAKCGVNEKKNFDSNSCEPCPPGYENPYYNHEMSNCTICPKDTYSSESGCTYCPAYRITRTRSYTGKTSNPGASNVNQCYLECTTESNIYYSNDKYDLELCGKSACDGPLDYWGSNIAAPPESSIAFDSTKRIQKTYSKWNHNYGHGMCQADSKPDGLIPWDNCDGNTLLSNDDYCCGPYANTKQLNSSNNYCECQPAPDPHSNQYRAVDGKCVIQCASVPANSNFTYASNADLSDCYKVCKSNYYLSNDTCALCPDGGYSDPGSTNIRSCYKTKDTHGDDSPNKICVTPSKKIDGNIGNRRVMYLSSNYDQQYCKNTCPGGFQSVSPTSRYTNMDKYVYRGPTEVYGACPSYEDVDNSNLYKIDLTSSGTASNALASFDSNEDYYLCSNQVQFTRRSGNNFASCCESNQKYDFRNARCEDLHVRYVRTSFYEPGKHTNTDVYERQEQTGPAPPTQFISDILPNNQHHIWPVYKKNPIGAMSFSYSNIPGSNALSSLTGDSNDQYLYRCRNSTDNINLFSQSGKFHCCPSNLPYIEPGGVCTVSCGNSSNSITYNGKCYVEANLADGNYALIKGKNFVGKYSSTYGLGIGEQNNYPEQNCWLYFDIDQNENSISVQIWNPPPGSGDSKTLGYSTGMLVESGSGYPTLYVELEPDSEESAQQKTTLAKFMFIISQKQDNNWNDSTNKIFYSYLVNLNGIRYLRFREFPRVGQQNKLNTNIPRNAEVPFFSILDFENYANDNAKECPPDKRGQSVGRARSNDGVDSLETDYGLSNNMYLWDPSYECRLQCANALNEFGKPMMVHFNAGADQYDACPQQSYPAAWNNSASNDRQIECRFERGGTVPDYQIVPTRECAIDTDANKDSAQLVSADRKVLCINETVWSPLDQTCMYKTEYYDYDPGAQQTYDSINGDSNQIKYRMTVKPKMKYTWMGVDSNSAPAEGNNTTDYECSIINGPSTASNDIVTSHTPPICCAKSNDTVTNFNFNNYCCPNAESYIESVGCLPNTCVNGIFIKEKCFNAVQFRSGNYYPIKYENSNLLLNDDSVVSRVDNYNDVIQVNNTGKMFWEGTAATRTKPQTFSYNVAGFYSNDNKIILRLDNGGDKYLIDHSGQPFKIINGYINANESNFYLDLNTMSGCPTSNLSPDSKWNNIKNRNQKYVNTSNECVYYCPVDCGTDNTYTYSSNFDGQCPEKTCTKKEMGADGVFKQVDYNIPCSSNCCTYDEGYVPLPTNWSSSDIVVSDQFSISCPTGTLKKVKPTSTSDSDYAPFYYCNSNDYIVDITCPTPALLNNEYCYDEGLSNDADINGCTYDSNSSNDYGEDIGYLYLCDNSPNENGDGSTNEGYVPVPTNWSSDLVSDPLSISCPTGTLKKVKPTSTSDSDYAPFYYCNSNDYIVDITCPTPALLNNEYCYDEGLSNDADINGCTYDSNSSNDYGEDIGYLYLCEETEAPTPARPANPAEPAMNENEASPPPPSLLIKKSDKWKSIDDPTPTNHQAKIQCPSGTNLTLVKTTNNDPIFWYCDSNNEYVIPMTGCPDSYTSKSKASPNNNIPSELLGKSLLCYDNQVNNGVYTYCPVRTPVNDISIILSNNYYMIGVDNPAWCAYDAD